MSNATIIFLWTQYEWCDTLDMYTPKFSYAYTTRDKATTRTKQAAEFFRAEWSEVKEFDTPEMLAHEFESKGRQFRTTIVELKLM